MKVIYYLSNGKQVEGKTDRECVAKIKEVFPPNVQVIKVKRKRTLMEIVCS